MTWILDETMTINILTKNAGVLTDATSLVVVVSAPPLEPGKKPAARVLTTYTYGVDIALVRDSVGTYHLDLALARVGEWRYTTTAVVATKTRKASRKFEVGVDLTLLAT